MTMSCHCRSSIPLVLLVLIHIRLCALFDLLGVVLRMKNYEKHKKKENTRDNIQETKWEAHFTFNPARSPCPFLNCRFLPSLVLPPPFRSVDCRCFNCCLLVRDSFAKRWEASSCTFQHAARYSSVSYPRSDSLLRS